MIRGTGVKAAGNGLALVLLGLAGLLAGCGHDTDTTTPTVTFSSPPSSVVAGSQFTLTWTSTDDISCKASGGDGGASWNGPEPTTGSATVTASSTPNTYNYVLTCIDSNNNTGTATAVVNVTPSTQGPPSFTTAFSASPSPVPAGGTVTLKWATNGATSCTASGGDGGASWKGTEPTSSPTNGVTVTASTTPGSYSYVLTCTGPGGSTAQTATVTVSGTPPPNPPAFTSPLTATPSATVPGGSFQMSWATTGATACTASGGDGGASWHGTEPTSSPTNGVTVTASTTPGSYAYVLSCSGAGGTIVQVATVLVGGFDCSVPNQPTRALLVPNASVTTFTGGVLCLVCSVSQPGNVIDTNPTNFAAILTQVGLLNASESLTVTNNTPIPAGRLAGFVLANPKQLLTLDLLQSLTISTSLQGKPQESAGAVSSDNLRLDLVSLGLIGNTAPSFVGFTTSKPFDAVTVTDGPLAGVLGEVDVYHACVSVAGGAP